ncbi:DNA-binding transcriptional MerR regulator [Bosea sp. OAE752]|uniref:MerR family transcriptional regulator n=1 Tax=Bosea sp. OAE752 TaxID=2663873 RepID=UPI003D1F8F8C
MTDRRYTIGQVSRLTGVSTRRIRFYADEGLLPPYSRTEAGYRVFSGEDVARLELITALRETEASLGTIASVLSKKATLREVLTAQLAEVEHRITAQRRIASTMRSALQSTEPTVRDLKRVANMIDIAHSERREIAKAFFDKVTDGIEIDPRWKLRMIEIGTPELPEEPTKEQADAWIDLAKLFDSEDFYKSMRLRAEDTAVTGLQYEIDPLDKRLLAHIELMKQVRAAMSDGLAPDSELGQSIAEQHLTDSALIRKEPDAEAFRIVSAQWYGCRNRS